MKLEEIKSLIDSINQSNIEKFKFKDNEVELEIVNGNGSKQSNLVKENNRGNRYNEALETVEKQVSNSETIKSPLVGVYYEASGPNEKSFVVEGQQVKKGDVLCIVEAMKVMNEIVAQKDCIIKKILVSNEDIVEYDQDLFMIE